MIVLDVQQGTDEWRKVRAGVPTASQFHRIITPKTLKPSAQMQGYAYELAAERILGSPVNDSSSSFMERGTALEQTAKNWYEWETDTDIKDVGFCLADFEICGHNGTISAGCSPDFLVGDDGIGEIKIPAIGKHIGHLVDDFEAEYRCQTQGELWICERDWIDLISFNPHALIPSRILRCYRDEKFIKALEAAIGPLLELIVKTEEKVRSMMGCTIDDVIDRYNRSQKRQIG
jgi:hypothetical protein